VVKRGLTKKDPACDRPKVFDRFGEKFGRSLGERAQPKARPFGAVEGADRGGY
jgi:hypothetical protein